MDETYQHIFAGHPQSSPFKMPRTEMLPMDALTKEAIRTYHTLLNICFITFIQAPLLPHHKYQRDAERLIIAPQNLLETWTSPNQRTIKTNNPEDNTPSAKTNSLSSSRTDEINTTKVANFNNISPQFILTISATAHKQLQKQLPNVPTPTSQPLPPEASGY